MLDWFLMHYEHLHARERGYEYVYIRYAMNGIDLADHENNQHRVGKFAAKLRFFFELCK